MANEDRFILSPFFLASSLPGLEGLVQSDWLVNSPRLTALRLEDRLNQVHEPLNDLVERTLTRNKRPIAVIGDCCQTIGVMAGLQRAGIHPAMIWLDAHGDFNTWKTSPSGFLGGMPMAMLVGRGDQSLLAAVGSHPIPEDKVFLTDARELDPAESEAVQESSVHHLKDLAQLLDCPLPDGPVYVHFDTDVVAGSEVPAQNYLADGGPSATLVEQVFERLSSTGQVVAVSMSTWNPGLPGADRSREICMHLLSRLL